MSDKFIMKYIYPRWQSLNLLTRIGFSLIMGSGFEAACLALFLPEYSIRRLMLMFPGVLGFWCIVLGIMISWVIVWNKTPEGREFLARS
jgi:hypothetical protein